MLAKKTNLVRQTENKKLRLSVERGGKRISEIDKLIEKVFEQNAAGILSDERFSKLLQNYECEQKRLQTEIEEWKAALDDVGQKVTDLRLLLHTLREITEIKELTPTLVNTLIERIEVHNNDKSSGHCYVKVDVYFTAVGMIDIPTEQEILAMMEEMQKKSSVVSFYRIIRKTVQPISELHRIGIKPKHPYVALAFVFTRFFICHIYGHDRPNGEAKIREYYEIAPGIVEAINQKSNAQEIWNEVYKDLVEPCVNMIHNNKNESAYTLYKLYSLKLNQKYKA